MELGVMAHNLLIEEYPLATRDLTQIGSSHWLLDTMVCDYVGIGRFVIGLSDDIRILTPEFEEYIQSVINRMYNSYNTN